MDYKKIINILNNKNLLKCPHCNSTDIEIDMDYIDDVLEYPTNTQGVTTQFRSYDGQMPVAMGIIYRCNDCWEHSELKANLTNTRIEKLD